MCEKWHFLFIPENNTHRVRSTSLDFLGINKLCPTFHTSTIYDLIANRGFAPFVLFQKVTKKKKMWHNKNNIKEKIQTFDKRTALENFWKDKLSAQKILKEKKFLENIVEDFNSTVNEIENVTPLFVDNQTITLTLDDVLVYAEEVNTETLTKNLKDDYLTFKNGDKKNRVELIVNDRVNENFLQNLDIFVQKW